MGFKQVVVKVAQVRLGTKIIQNLPKLIKNYSLDNIFNMDESGLFFNYLTDKTFILKANIVCEKNIENKE